MTRRAALLLAAIALVQPSRAASAQAAPAALAAERRAFAEWLATSPLSPRAALLLHPIGAGVSLADDFPGLGLPAARVREERGAVRLSGAGGERVLRPGAPVALGGVRLVAAGVPGRRHLAVYGTPKPGAPPAYYPYDPALALEVTLLPPARPGTVLLLTAEGTEARAAEAGRVIVRVGSTTDTLIVRRMPGATADESELEVYFRDATNGRGSYTSGRFVALEPLGGGRFRLDFNRARNPFCAESTVFPCPAPWGNTVRAEVRAGRRYEEGG